MLRKILAPTTCYCDSIFLKINITSRLVKKPVHCFVPPTTFSISINVYYIQFTFNAIYFNRGTFCLFPNKPDPKNKF